MQTETATTFHLYTVTTGRRRVVTQGTVIGQAAVSERIAELQAQPTTRIALAYCRDGVPCGRCYAQQCEC